jgi:predicted SnoaL-like aldol condensation-catalyzing enzyme
MRGAALFSGAGCRALLLCLALLSGCSATIPPRVDVAGHPDPLGALANPDATLAANKHLVFDMWRSVVNAGHIEAADTMLAEGYTQHSPVLRTGRKAFKEIFSVVPRREIPALVEPALVRSIAEGDLVVMSLRETVAARDSAPAYITTHFNLFRVKDGHLAEHWHSVHTPPGRDVPLPEDGGPQPVTGAAGAAQAAMLESADPALARNKRLVFDLWREIVDAGHEELAARYVDAGYIEHRQGASSGIAGFRQHFAARADRTTQPWMRAPVVAIVAEGDVVAVVTMQTHPHPVHPGRTYTTTWFDMFRIVNGRIAEHWDDAEPNEPPVDGAW